MIGSASGAQLGVNLQIGVRFGIGILISMNVFCTLSPLHEFHMLLCIVQYDLSHHMKKTCRGTLFLINLQLRGCPNGIRSIAIRSCTIRRVTCIARDQGNVRVDQISLRGQIMKQIGKLTYLESLTTSDGNFVQDIERSRTGAT